MPLLVDNLKRPQRLSRNRLQPVRMDVLGDVVPPEVLAALSPKRMRVLGRPGKMFDILVSAWQATLRENTPVIFGGETCKIVVRNAAWRNRRCSI